MRQARLLLAPALAAVLAACAHTPAPAYQPGVDNLRALRAAAATPLAVGDFDAGPKVDDERLGGLRGSSMSGAEDGSTGYSNVAARFVLRRGEDVVFDKEIAARAEWESSFIGALAIPAGMQGYVSAVQKLAGALFADPEFQAATR